MYQKYFTSCRDLFIIYELNLFKKRLDINKYDKHLISEYIFIFFILQEK